MQRLVLHIGHSKCGSSTLQGYMSSFPILPIDGFDDRVVRYLAVSKSGNVLHGANLTKVSGGNPFGYLDSSKNVLSDEHIFSDMIRSIASICGPNDTVVLSNEGWSDLGFVTPEVEAIINTSPIPIDVFMLTRPTVEWINAAWWQWGTWRDGNTADEIINDTNVNFLKSLHQWRKVKQVQRVALHDVSQGPLLMFLSFVGAAQAASNYSPEINLASDFNILRHVLRNKDHYSRNVHNPTIEFRLNSLIPGSRAPLPFVVSRATARYIIQRDNSDAEELFSFMLQGGYQLPAEVKRRYVDPSSYDHLPDKVDIVGQLEADYSDAFVGQLIDTILDLGRRLALSGALLPALEAFQPEQYFELNEDVRESGMNAYEHFLRFGLSEGRRLG